MSNINLSALDIKLVSMTLKNDDILADLQVNRLPTLPHVLVEMLDACQGNHASFQSLSGIIGRDAAISARVVSLANSSLYNRGANINSVERALFVLGIDTIKTLVITVSVQQFFSGFNQAHSNFLKQFWRSSLTCALFSKSLAILTSYPNPDEAYLAGLLHNIGELVLKTNYPAQYDGVTGQTSSLKRLEKEKQLFNCTHPQIGAHLAREWNLSPFTADAIEFHHAAENTILDAHHLVKLVYLSGQLSQTEDELTKDIFDSASNLFELNASLINEIHSKINSEVQALADSMSIDISDSENTSSDHDKQIALATKIRNIGLLQSATHEISKTQTIDDLNAALQSSIDLLFGYRHSAIFWYQEEANELIHQLQGRPEIAPLKLKLEENRSLVADAALQSTLICSLSANKHLEPLSILDQQLLRLLHSRGLICIPLQAEPKETLLGVLVMGTHQAIKEKSGQQHLLHYFAQEVSSICKEVLDKLNQDKNLPDSDELTQRAREIAHEANNPLNIIGNYLATLSSKLKHQDDVQEELSILKEEVERAGSILIQLKDLQSSDINEGEHTSINDEISRLIKLYNGSLFVAHGISSHLSLDSELPDLHLNRNRLRQVLTNLIKNAVEALTEGGAITLSTHANVNMNGRDFVEIRIKDDGPGIPPEILRHLFKPVTSTKGQGHSGLGLSITKNLVNEINGSISCRSSDQGTEFQILLPMKQPNN